MSSNRFRRGVTVLAASSLSLGLISAGVVAGSASAVTARNTVPGVTASSITIGATVPLSGIAAGYAEVSAAAQAVFKYVNSKHHGVNGRNVNYIRLDDCYGFVGVGGCTAPGGTTTLALTQSLVTSSHVFATVGSLGTATQETVLNYLKTAGVPQLFVNSGSSRWNAPAISIHKTDPLLYGFQTSYITEGKIFASYVHTTYAGQKVGFIGQGDDFGLGGYTGLTIGPIHTAIASADKIYYNAADALVDFGDIGPAVAKLQSDSVKVAVLYSIPPVTALILQKAALIGYHPHWIISSVGSNPVSVNLASENGLVSSDALPATNDHANPWNVWLRKVLANDHTDFPSYTGTSTLDGNEQYGAAFAVAFLETLSAFGHTAFTQASFAAKMQTVVYSTPSITPLHYTASNHQGLLCAVLSTIVSNGTASGEFITTPSHVVKCSNDSANGAITTGVYHVTAVPAYLS